MMQLSVVIPAYNEEDRIIPTIQQFNTFLSAKNIAFEIIVVDDGSSDKTVEKVSALKHQMFSVEIISLRENRGKGCAVRQGMLAAEGQICMFSDADGSTPVWQLDKLLQPILEDKADIVIGSRYLHDSDVVKAQPGMRVAWSRLVNWFVQKLILPGIADPHCGFKAFSADAVRQIFPPCMVNGWSFDLEVLALARRMRLRTAEVPVTWVNDERSKARIRHLPREFYNVYKIRKRLQNEMAPA
ncbi:dolichyl-phosphate beta-glucosyltransferase [Chitinophagaceae bacterium MMS25-I14]